MLSDLSMIDFELPGKPGRRARGRSRPTADPATVEAFDRYYLGAPALKRVRFASTSQRAAWAAMMRGEIDMLHEVSPEAAEFVEAGVERQVDEVPGPYYDAIVFNLRHPILSKREVRVALNEAIDRCGDRAPQHARTRATRQLDRSGRCTGRIRRQCRTFRSTRHRAAERLDAAGLAAGRSARTGHGCRADSVSSAWCSRTSRASSESRSAFSDSCTRSASTWRSCRLRRADWQGAQTGDFDAALMEFVGSRSLNRVYILWHSPQPGMHRSRSRAATWRRRRARPLPRGDR